MGNVEMLYELCETVSKEIEKFNQELRKRGGELKMADVEIIDKLTHALKSIKATIAMEESKGGSYAGGSYAGGSYAGGGGSYAGGGSYGDRRYAMYGYEPGAMSYAGGRTGANQYGSYAGGYSRADGDYKAKVEDLMRSAPNEDMRRAAEQILSKLETM